MKKVIAVAALSSLLAVSACGGGENGPATSESRLDLDYSSSADERYSYSEYETRSHVYLWALNGDATQTYIGGDLEPREALRHVATVGGIRWFMGATRDGVGVDRISNYENDLLTGNGTDPLELSGDGFYPFVVQPTLNADPDILKEEHAGIWRALYDSVLILNDALPSEFQIILGSTRIPTLPYSGEIYVSLESPATISLKCGVTAVACAANNRNLFGGYTTSSVLYIPDDFDVSEYMYPRSVIVHELLHALGVWGHVDSVEFPDSIMGASGEYIPNLGHIISKIDREVLQIMYMSQRTDLYNDWGEWSDTTFHLMGESEGGAMRYGVALFNGLPQPWVTGVSPDTELADNNRLFGTATWQGSLLGFSGPSPIAGAAELEVNLATLADTDSEQDLRFWNIYFINRFESESEDRWFSTQNIDYRVTVHGNEFRNLTGDEYEEGYVTGAFLGSEHEHMAGTVKRTDMVAAFGGSR